MQLKKHRKSRATYPIHVTKKKSGEAENHNDPSLGEHLPPLSFLLHVILTTRLLKDNILVLGGLR